MRCGIITIDERGTVTTFNQQAREILELDGAPLEGHPVEAVLQEHPRLARVLLDSLDMDSPPNRAEIDIRSRDAQGRTIGFTISAITEVGGVALFFKDLTSVEQQEERERLRDRLAALGEMAASLAHEIRNPLASIEVTASLLRRRLAGHAPELALLDKITSEVRRLNGTITHSLEYARPIHPVLSPCRIEVLLEDALASAAARSPGAGVRVERRFDDGLPDLLLDGGLMRQVFLNILSNAYDAMPEGGTLTVETSTVPLAGARLQDYRFSFSARDELYGEFDTYVQVTISDTGEGIRPEAREKLFFPFFTTKENGSGVGLSMARKLVECHRGTIDAGKGPEGGALFRVRLPLLTEGQTESREVLAETGGERE
jgi:nitrogen-specific signal transduction histidine kinase